MEREVFQLHLEQFMLSPLVTWVKTFGQNNGNLAMDYSELLDGVVLNRIMVQINPKVSLLSLNQVIHLPSQRMQNLTILIRHIKTYYLETLRQLITMPLPNVLLLGKTPRCEQSLEEMKKILLLLLGCAVQCEKKEEYIDRIQTLDFDTKAAIAAHIQEVTHSQDSVLDLHWLEASEVCPEDLEHLFRRLVDQRDTQLETIVELMQERESTPLPSPPSAQSPGECPIMQQQTTSHQHLSVELADSKAKIRRLRQELEEKSEQVLDCRQELENVEAEFKRIRHENSVLLADARAARTYRDELDALRERAIRADKLESELGRYRERLHNMEFYKAKVEELKEDNAVLLETKAVLEEQLEGWRSQSDKIHQLEKHSLLLQTRVQDMEQEKEVDRRLIKELQEENLALELAQRRSMDESQHLGWELEQLSKSPDNSPGQKSLSEEVVDRTRSRLLKLERENQSLLRTIEELRADCSSGPQQDHNHEHTQRNGQPPTNKVTSQGPHQNTIATHALAATQTHIKTHTCSGSRQTTLNPGILIPEYTGSLEKASWEMSELVIKEDCDMDTDTTPHSDTKTRREDGHCLERENFKEKMDLHKHEKGPLEYRDSCDRTDPVAELEALVKDNNNKLIRCCPSVPLTSDPSSCSKNNSWENSSTGQPARSFSSSVKHTERLEAKCKALDTENQWLQASLDNTGRKLQRLEAEVQEMEAENQSLQAGLEELRISSRRLEQLEQEKQTLEQDASGLERDNRRLEKENRRLRQQAEIQDSTLDGSNLRLANLERENRDLLSLENELERLAHELEIRVLNQDASPQSHQETPVDSRFKMLESELESSLKRSLQMKEDKMAALEARLQESSSLNQQLRQELRTVRLNYEALLQREEEERLAAHSPAPQRESDRAVSEWQRESQEATRELLRVKDRLIEVERNNATLQAERQALQAQLRQLETQSDCLQAQILALQRQTASLQENNTALQTHNANLQVEKSTLNSQSASLLAQNAQLQRLQSGAEAEKENAAREREELRGVHEQLLRDHERLAALHERQATEYEALLGKHGCLKNAHRTLELEHRTIEDRYTSLLQQKSKLEGLELALREEQDNMSLEKEQHRTTASECQRLRDEKDWLNHTYRQLLKDQEELQADHKNLKTLLNSTKLEQTKLESDFNQLREQYQQLDITSTKLTNQCELLSQLKGNLEEENRHLLDQIQTLMLQNRTLLEQTMESKDLFHVEQRQYIDKLNELRRQKEKLEEKIMDQYKFYDPSPPRRRGNWITLKMKKLIKSRSRERCATSNRSLTPTRSGSCEALPPTSSSPSASCCQDNGSFVGSDGSGKDKSCVLSTPMSVLYCKLTCSFPPSPLSLPLQSLSISTVSFSTLSFSTVSFSTLSFSTVSPSPLSLLLHCLSFSTVSPSPLSLLLRCLSISAVSPSPLSLLLRCLSISAVSPSPLSLLLRCLSLSTVSPSPLSPSSLSLHLHCLSISTVSRPCAPPASQTQQQFSSTAAHTSSQHRERTHAKISSPVAITNTCGLIPYRGKEVGSAQDPWPRRSVLRRCSSGSRAPRRPSDGNLPKTAQGQVAVVSQVRLRGPRSPTSLPRASNVISTAEGSSRRSSVNSDCRGMAKTDPLPVVESHGSPNQEPDTHNQNQNSTKGLDAVKHVNKVQNKFLNLFTCVNEILMKYTN
uniref:Calponin-homology (CH) domain-containing protein n=1 Tax=Esox lucius TaxID=8010 RepID=A0A6Q2XS05_ESOLU